MSLISRVQLPNGAEYDFKGSLITVVGTQTTNTAAWTGSLPLTALEDGLTIAFFLPRTSSSNVTLKLTLRSGTQTDAIPVYFSGNTRMGTQFPAGSIVILTYYSAGSISIGGTATTDNRWQTVNYTDTNTNNAVTQTQTTSSHTGTYDILMSTSTTNSGTKTEGALKDSTLKFTPSTDTLEASNINATTINGVTVGNSPEFTDTTYTASTGIKITSGNDIQHTNSVTGGAKTTQGVYPITFDAQGHITGSGTAYTIGDAASKGVDTSITLGSTSTNLPTSKAVSDLIQSLDKPMVFKGTIGDGTESPTPTQTWSNLPTASSSNMGFSYIAVSSHGTAPICKKGDMIVSNSTEWIVIPSGDEPTGTVTQVNIAVTTGNTGVVVGGGPITTSGTLTVGHADTSSQSSVVATSGIFVDGVSLDDYGHVTGLHTSSVEATDEKVKQTPKTDNNDYRVLLSGSANDTEETKGVNKNTNLKYNPSTQSLSVVKINGVTVGSSPKFTDSDTITTVTYNKTNGAGTFQQIKDSTTTNIFTTTDKYATKINSWSDGTLPSLTTEDLTPVGSVTPGTPGQTYSVSDGMLVISNGTETSSSPMTVKSVKTWSQGAKASLSYTDNIQASLVEKATT